MSAADIQAPAFTDDNTAREAIEALMWPDGPVCPHCGNVEQAKIGKVEGKSARAGLYYCGACKSQFTVTVGTIFERSKVPLSKWWLAIHFLASGKKGTSSHQLHRMLGVSYQTAWFMTHRIREAMRDGSLAPMGGAGSIVEVDESYIGKREGFTKVMGGSKPKNTVLTLVERGGSARSFHIDRATKAEIVPIVKANIDRESRLMTDEANQYTHIGREFASHQSVDHSREEYAYYDKPSDTVVSTNTVEGYYSIFKRGFRGVYQHCAEKHLHRYLSEYDFRYSNRAKLGVNDAQRAAKIVQGAKGKRLMYRRPDEGLIA
jgi:transposase-like protein